MKIWHKVLIIVLGFLPVVMALFVISSGRRVHAQEHRQEIKSWLIWQDTPRVGGDPGSVYKIQDGSCFIYIYTRSERYDTAGIAIGPGCK